MVAVATVGSTPIAQRVGAQPEPADLPRLLPRRGTAGQRGLEPGYYPAIGWPAGTVVGWDGVEWQGPVTVPGYYDVAGRGLVWWNGRTWAPDIVAERPSPPARRARAAWAHRRRRPWAPPVARVAVTSAAAGAMLLVVAHIR